MNLPFIARKRGVLAGLFALGLTACGEQKTAEDTDTRAGSEPTYATPPMLVEGSLNKLTDDKFQFTEGPAWNGGNKIYFTDVPQGLIYSWTLDSGEFQLEYDDTAQANGLMFTRDGKLRAPQHKSNSVVEIDLNTHERTTVAGEYNGKPFNRPNDQVIDQHNGFYFTDPTWAETYPQPVKGVYYVSPEGEINLLIEDMNKPNGIVLSPDESRLYVVDSESFIVRRYPVIAPSELGEMEAFATLKAEPDYQGDVSGADGIAIDADENLYVTSRIGVQVFNKQGDHLGVITLEDEPTNLDFFGEQMNRLFITARKNVYTVELDTTGVRFPQ